MAQTQRVGMPERAKVKWSFPGAPPDMTEHNTSSTSKNFQQQLQAGRLALSDLQSRHQARAAAQGRAIKDLEVTRWVYPLLYHSPPFHPNAILVKNTEAEEI